MVAQRLLHSTCRRSKAVLTMKLESDPAGSPVLTAPRKISVAYVVCVCVRLCLCVTMSHVNTWSMLLHVTVLRFTVLRSL